MGRKCCARSREHGRLRLKSKLCYFKDR
jgi:hypothetical protein